MNQIQMPVRSSLLFVPPDVSDVKFPIEFSCYAQSCREP